MATPITPNMGYAFKNKNTNAVALMLFLGSGDSVDNYEEISKEYYEELQSVDTLLENEATEADYISALEDLGVNFNG